MQARSLPTLQQITDTPFREEVLTMGVASHQPSQGMHCAGVGGRERQGVRVCERGFWGLGAALEKG